VFAADSKLTTEAFVGLDTNGDPQFLPQTYDNAVKLGHDRNKSFMVAVTGNASVGERSVIDFVSQTASPRTVIDDVTQDQYLRGVIVGMGSLRFNYWTALTVPADRWPLTAFLLATTSPSASRPRVWRVAFVEDRCEISEILDQPWIYLEGTYAEAFSLLYSFRPEFLEQLRIELAIPEPTMIAALDIPKVAALKPIHRINVAAMPIQDAMDLAYFLANVQIEMERFLPGAPYCGGPVDLMVLQGVPQRDILEFAGKSLKHPRQPL